MRLKSNARWFLEETVFIGKLHVVYIIFFGCYFDYEAPQACQIFNRLFCAATVHQFIQFPRLIDS